MTEETFGEPTGGVETSWDGGGSRMGRGNRVSAFSSDGRGNFSRSESVGGMPVMRQDWGADYDEAMDERRVYDGMSALAARAKAVKRHNENLGNATLLSAMKISQQNGGRLPAYALDNVMRNLGMDGRTRAIGGMGYTQNGDFVIDMLTPGQNGGIVRTPRVIKPIEQYKMMCNGGGEAFGHQDIASFRQRLKDNHGYTDSELGAVPDFTNVRRGAQIRQSQAAAQGLDKLISGIVQSAMKSKSSDPRRDAAYELLSKRDFRDYIYRGDPKTNEDGTPKMVEDKDGNMVQEYETLSDADMMKRLDGIIDHYFGTGTKDGSADDNRKWVESLLDKYYGPRQLTPEEKEIQQRRMNNALEDQQRADVMRGEQRLVDYIDANGVWRRGNGYVVDGKVYDAGGREIEGATLMRQNSRAEGQNGGVRSFVTDESAERARMATAQPQNGRGLAGTSAAALGNGGMTTAATGDKVSQLQEERAQLQAAKARLEQAENAKTVPESSENDALSDSDMKEVNSTIFNQTNGKHGFDSEINSLIDDIKALEPPKKEPGFEDTLTPQDKVVYDVVSKMADETGKSVGAAGESNADIYTALAEKIPVGKIKDALISFFTKLDQLGENVGTSDRL